MNLYLYLIDSNDNVISYSEWLITDKPSLVLINNKISKERTEYDVYIPLCFHSDMECLRYNGRTILYFTQDVRYYLVDMEHPNYQATLREIRIKQIVDGTSEIEQVITS